MPRTARIDTAPPVPCPGCSGTGQVLEADGVTRHNCTICGGSGRISTSQAGRLSPGRISQA